LHPLNQSTVLVAACCDCLTAESVAVGLEGELVMLDRTNTVYEATPDGDGGYTLQTQVHKAAACMHASCILSISPLHNWSCHAFSELLRQAQSLGLPHASCKHEPSNVFCHQCNLCAFIALSACCNACALLLLLLLQPVVKFGAGRPLGYHFDAEGHLVVADSLKVGAHCGMPLSI
jgi:hypothetical protein